MTWKRPLRCRIRSEPFTPAVLLSDAWAEPGGVRRLRDAPKVPHMGWNTIEDRRGIASVPTRKGIE